MVDIKINGSQDSEPFIFVMSYISRTYSSLGSFLTESLAMRSLKKSAISTNGSCPPNARHLFSGRSISTANVIMRSIIKNVGPKKFVSIIP